MKIILKDEEEFRIFLEDVVDGGFFRKPSSDLVYRKIRNEIDADGDIVVKTMGMETGIVEEYFGYMRVVELEAELIAWEKKA